MHRQTSQGKEGALEACNVGELKHLTRGRQVLGMAGRRLTQPSCLEITTVSTKTVDLIYVRTELNRMKGKPADISESQTAYGAYTVTSGLSSTWHRVPLD